MSTRRTWLLVAMASAASMMIAGLATQPPPAAGPYNPVEQTTCRPDQALAGPVGPYVATPPAARYCPRPRT